MYQKCFFRPVHVCKRLRVFISYYLCVFVRLFVWYVLCVCVYVLFGFGLFCVVLLLRMVVRSFASAFRCVENFVRNLFALRRFMCVM